jgi:hypothetical protein
MGPARPCLRALGHTPGVIIPYSHLVVTGGGLSLDGKRWIETDPRFFMHHGGLKKRWQYHVCTAMKKAQIDRKSLDPNTEVMRF